MTGNTTCKVLFGFWLAFALVCAATFVVAWICGDLIFDFFAYAILSAVICANYWELWHVETPTIRVNVVCRDVTCDEVEESE